MDLKGKTILVTGAARGLGASIASGIAAQGVNLALVDLSVDSLERTQQACEELGVTTKRYAANVADEKQVVSLFQQAVADFGRMDGLINNAGILRDGLLVKAKDGEIASKLSLEDWQAVIDVNLTGVFLCGREAAEQMIRLGNGG
jgi:3-oxoacyl-[acyl-carrier protein] reductase